MHLAKGQLVCVAFGFAAAVMHVADKDSLAAQDHRYELLACALSNLQVPLPWGISAALRSIEDDPTTVGSRRWAAEALAAGLYIPSRACEVVFASLATSERDALDHGLECALGLGYSALTWSDHHYRLYGGLDDMVRFFWAAAAHRAGYYQSSHYRSWCMERMLAHALRLAALFAIPAADADEHGFLIAVQIELLLCTSQLRARLYSEREEESSHAGRAGAATDGATVIGPVAIGERIEVFNASDSWWAAGLVIDSRQACDRRIRWLTWNCERQLLIEYTSHGGTAGWVGLAPYPDTGGAIMDGERHDEKVAPAGLKWRRHDESGTEAGVRIPLPVYLALATAYAMIVLGCMCYQRRRTSTDDQVNTPRCESHVATQQSEQGDVSAGYSRGLQYHDDMRLRGAVGRAKNAMWWCVSCFAPGEDACSYRDNMTTKQQEAARVRSGL